MLFDTITHLRPVEKGWSGDRKYCAADDAGHKYLLRISPPERHDRVKAMTTRMHQLAQLEIPMCQAVEFGLCDEGVYTLESWIDGEDAEAVLPRLSTKKQYAYGLDAGRILKKIHSIPAPAEAGSWAERFNRKIDRKIAMYESCELKYEDGEAFLLHIERSRHLLEGRPQSYQHGDYHVGNMMIDNKGRLTIIDFEREDYGDPWEEFNRIVWCAQCAPCFASGMVDGYFDGQVPMAFWNLLALYICSNTLSSLPWAVPFGDKEIQTMRRQAAEILQWYDGFRTVIPCWYHNRKA